MDTNKPPAVFLFGERLYARPVDDSDAERFQRWMNDPAVRDSLGHHLPMSERMQREFLEGVGKRPDEIHLCLALKDSDRHIGGMGLIQINAKDRVALFGIYIGEGDCRGKGYGLEATRLMLRYAFETLNLNRVELNVFDFNRAAIHVYEKVGFVREGVRRESCFLNGRYHDTLAYGLLAREYFAAAR